MFGWFNLRSFHWIHVKKLIRNIEYIIYSQKSIALLCKGPFYSLIDPGQSRHLQSFVATHFRWFPWESCSASSKMCVSNRCSLQPWNSQQWSETSKDILNKYEKMLPELLGLRVDKCVQKIPRKEHLLLHDGLVHMIFSYGAFVPRFSVLHTKRHNFCSLTRVGMNLVCWSLLQLLFCSLSRLVWE